MVSTTRPLIIVLFSVLIAGKVTLAQKINPKRPSVYITFKEFIAETPDPAYPSQGARLTVHNNTRWPIYFWERYDPTVAGAQIAYNIIDVTNGCRIERTYTDVVFHRKLAPGQKLDFVVRRGDLPAQSKIYVPFYFSFEKFAGRREPEHRADFLASELPPWPKDASNARLEWTRHEGAFHYVAWASRSKRSVRRLQCEYAVTPKGAREHFDDIAKHFTEEDYLGLFSSFSSIHAVLNKLHKYSWSDCSAEGEAFRG